MNRRFKQRRVRSICLRASSAEREQAFEPGAMLFMAGAGCPNATDLERGRRPGSLLDYEETLKLQQSFDVIHMFGPSAAPQDAPVRFRHYAMMRAQPVHGDKPMFAYARGRRQVAESFELVRLGLELSEEEFSKGSWVTTITNSLRQIDIPMAEGVIDFARAGRVITPFCLAGARRLWRVRFQCRYEVRFARIRNPRACQNDDRVRTTRPPYRPCPSDRRPVLRRTRPICRQPPKRIWVYGRQCWPTPRLPYMPRAGRKAD